MQTVARVQPKAVATKARTSRPAVVRVVAKAQSPVKLAQKAAAAVATLPALIAANPAFALVDERMNGDGTGLPFGINDTILGWHLCGVFVVLWAIWYNGQKDLGDFEDDDSGLRL